MSPTEKAHRSDAIYYDTNNVHRRQLCDTIADREARIEDLEACIRDMLQALNLAMNGVRVTNAQYLSFYNRTFKQLGVARDAS